LVKLRTICPRLWPKKSNLLLRLAGHRQLGWLLAAIAAAAAAAETTAAT